MSFFKKIGANREVLALSIGRFGDGIVNSMLFVVIPLHISQLPAPLFSFPETERAGILISLFGLVAGLCQPLTDALVDRLNRRKPFILIGLILLADATISFSYTHRYYLALIVRAFQGLGLALTIPPTLQHVRQELKGSVVRTRGATLLPNAGASFTAVLSQKYPPDPMSGVTATGYDCRGEWMQTLTANEESCKSTTDEMNRQA